MDVRRVAAREGYDLWAKEYDETENPVVWMDTQFVPSRLAPRPGERILDAGCGTGRYFPTLLDGGGTIVGVDFSAGMLAVAHHKHPGIPLVQADLQTAWPFATGAFDAVVCGLVGEHLGDLSHFFAEMKRVVRTGGRILFSVYHPAMAAAGKEAKFERDATEYRPGAEKHETADYVDALQCVGFEEVRVQEIAGTEALAQAMPVQVKYIDFPMLLIFEAETDSGAGASHP